MQDAAVSENAKTTNLHYGEAFGQLLKGEPVTKKNWLTQPPADSKEKPVPQQWIKVIDSGERKILALFTRGGGVSTYSPNGNDQLETDWMIATDLAKK